MTPPRTGYRRMQIILMPSVVEELTYWHSSASDPVYALSSTGANHPVSLSMISAAIGSLSVAKFDIKDKKHKKELTKLITDLEEVYDNWRNYREHESPLAQQYDMRDYGWSASDEHDFARASGALL